MNSANARFQSGIGGKPANLNANFSNREFLGLGAGRGNSSVEHETTRCSTPAMRKISRANSAQDAEPSHVR